MIRTKRHDRHQVVVQINVDSGEHWAALYCKTCQTNIQWLSRTDADFYISQGLPFEKIYGRKPKSKFKRKTLARTN